MVKERRNSSRERSATLPSDAPTPGATGFRAPTRRAVMAGLGAGLVAGGRAAAAEALPEAGAPFDRDGLIALARARAGAPYAAPRSDDLPALLRNLGREAYAAIRTAPGRAIWEGEGLGFTLEPLLRGSIYADPVQIFLVEGGRVQPLPYARDRFQADGLALPDLPPEAGYSGLRVRARAEGPDLFEAALFQGASFFRMMARGQRFGVTARALTLRPADARGEEFPLFRALFAERPGADGVLVLHALIESASAVAALRFALRPGERDTVCDVEAALFARQTLDHLGLGGCQASYLFGPLDRRNVDDARAAVHATDGLAILNGAGEAIWRPVHNPDTLQIAAFVDENPKGFGLMQRARDFGDYEDDAQRWECRPSLWLAPRDGWGPGAVTLLEIPSDSEFNENILTYWRPKEALAAGAELRFAYRQHWSWDRPEPPPLARVTGSRGGRGSAGSRRLFLVDFAGEELAGSGGIDVALSVAPGTVTRQQLVSDPAARTARVLFELDPGSERASELRLSLRRGGRPVSETWLYRWTP